MRLWLASLLAYLAERVAPKPERGWGVLVRLTAGGTYEHNGLTEFQAKALTEAYGYAHDERISGAKLIQP